MTENTHTGQPATSRRRAVLSRAAATTVAALAVATAGVVVQLVAGVDFPTVPPVLFILLIPAALAYFGRWWWAAIPAVLAGLFLTVGLFLSGESARLRRKPAGWHRWLGRALGPDRRRRSRRGRGRHHDRAALPRSLTCHGLRH